MKSSSFSALPILALAAAALIGTTSGVVAQDKQDKLYTVVPARPRLSDCNIHYGSLRRGLVCG